MSVVALLDHSAVADGAVPVLAVGDELSRCLEVISEGPYFFRPVPYDQADELEPETDGPNYRIVGSPTSDPALAAHLWLLRSGSYCFLPAVSGQGLATRPTDAKIEMRGTVAIAWGPSDYAKGSAAYLRWRVDSIQLQRTSRSDAASARLDDPKEELSEMVRWRQRGEVWRYFVALSLLPAVRDISA